MKLAEALLEKKEILTKLNILNDRIISNAIVQEGLKPNEEPKELIRELDEKLSRLETLSNRITKTNDLTLNNKGESLSNMLTKRDVLTKKLNILRDLINSANSITNRATRSEIRILPTISVVEIQKEIDSLSKNLRLLDVSIQELNWLTDLI